MKTNWQTKKLSDICDKFSSNISQNQLNDEVGMFPIYGASGFIKNISFFKQEKEYISIVKDGAGIGRISLLPAKSSIIGTLQGVIPKENIDIKFLFYIFSSFEFIKYKKGAAIPHIYFKDYSKEEFLIPSLSEQKRIVKILDEAFEKIEKAKENTEKNLQNSKELFESYLNNIFINSEKGWGEKRLKEVCSELFAGGDVPKNNLSKTRTEKYNIPIFANGFKDKGLYGYTNIKKVTKPSITISARGTIGYSEIRKEIFFPVVRLIVLIPDVKIIDLSFLYYITHNFKFSNTGTSIPQLTIPMIENIKIPIPLISEQKQIVKKLDALSEKTKKLEEIYQKKLEDLEELKKSILKKAFNGEL